MHKDNRIHILEMLAKYKFLCRSQFTALWLVISRNHFSNLMKSLTEKSVNFVWQKKFGYHPKFGKVEDLYFLKPKGKKYLINEHHRDVQSIHLPLGSKLFWNDYHHRKETINIRIQIEKEARSKGYTIDFYDMYFTGRSIPGKRGRECSTSIALKNGKIKADSIFLLRAPDWRKALYCLEYHNGTEVKRIMEQLRRHVEAISLGTPSSKYWIEIGIYVLNIFAFDKVLGSVKEQINQDSLFGNMKETILMISHNGNPIIR